MRTRDRLNLVRVHVTESRQKEPSFFTFWILLLILREKEGEISHPLNENARRHTAFSILMFRTCGTVAA